MWPSECGMPIPEQYTGRSITTFTNWLLIHCFPVVSLASCFDPLELLVDISV